MQIKGKKMREAGQSSAYQSIVGRCKMMCPPKEYEFRKKHHLFHALETKAGCHCVKEFHRSAAGEVVCHPDNLRPMNVLLETIDYLFNNILFLPGFSFVTIYDFIFDRLRSIRQDAVIQELQYTEPQMYSTMLEKCINFYCYAAYRKTVQPELAIDIYINTNHTKNCLETLLDTYCQMDFCFESASLQKSCLKMLSVYILQCHTSSESFIEVLMKVPRSLREMQPVKTSIGMCISLRSKNYMRFLRLATLLCHNWIFASLCWVCQDLQQIRSDTLQMLCFSHTSKVATFSSKDLRKWLLLQTENDVLCFCSSCGLETSTGSGVKFFKNAFKKPDRLPTGCYITHTINSLSDDKIIQFLMGSS